MDWSNPGALVRIKESTPAKFEATIVHGCHHNMSETNHSPKAFTIIALTDLVLLKKQEP